MNDKRGRVPYWSERAKYILYDDYDDGDYWNLLLINVAMDFKVFYFYIK
jgi:hypothetical protein